MVFEEEEKISNDTRLKVHTLHRYSFLHIRSNNNIERKPASGFHRLAFYYDLLLLLVLRPIEGITKLSHSDNRIPLFFNNWNTILQIIFHSQYCTFSWICNSSILLTWSRRLNVINNLFHSFVNSVRI